MVPEKTMSKPMTLRTTWRRPRRGPSPSRGRAFLVVIALVGVNYALFFAQGEEVAPPTLEERLQTPARPEPATEIASPAGPVAPGQPGAPGEPGSSPGAAGGEPATSPSAPPAQNDLQAPAPPRTDDGTGDGPALDDFGDPVGRKVAGSLQRGQTVLAAVGAAGIDGRTAMPVIKAMESVFDFRQAQVGDEFETWLDDEGQIRTFRYVQSPLDVYEVTLSMGGAEGGRYASRKVAVPTEVQVARVGCVIKSSLYASLARCGEGQQLGGLFIDLFAWDIDFFTDVRQGDELRVLVEKILVDGRFIKYGEVLGAEYAGRFGRHRIVRYEDPQGNEGYFTADGRAVRKEFLKSPLKYTRVSSGSPTALRAAAGQAGPVIYDAAEGTPVWAVASGTVVYASESGSLGTTVTIKHDNGFTSTYGHLAKIAAGIKIGGLVNQKTVLGAVGRSGKTSEPKLLFSLRRNGKVVNPFKVKFAEADPVPAEHRDHFDDQVEHLLRDLETTPLKSPES